jgi:hypothetical protein
MKRAPEWDTEEFEVLIDNPDVSAQDVSSLLPQRTPGAVEVVRQGLHSFHTGGNVSMLSKMMLRRLEERQGSVTCPVCRKRF